jgi:hypothetical protein
LISLYLFGYHSYIDLLYEYENIFLTFSKSNNRGINHYIFLIQKSGNLITSSEIAIIYLISLFSSHFGMIFQNFYWYDSNYFFSIHFDAVQPVSILLADTNIFVGLSQFDIYPV